MTDRHHMEPRAEHVWVRNVALFGDQWHPGILLWWEQTDDGWRGMVVVARPGIPARNDGPFVSQGYRTADAIRPYMWTPPALRD